MIKIYSSEDLMFMSDADVKHLLNHYVEITTNSNAKFSGIVINFEVAANEPHLLCGFILNSGKRIGYGSIKKLTVDI